MKVNLGRGFGPLDFDENGKFYSLFPENLPYIDGDFDGDSDEFTVYVDAELVEAVCNAGLDFDEFLSEDVEGREDMLSEAGIDPTQFDLDFDREIRDRLEEEGYFDEDFDEDDEYDEEDEDSDEEDEEYDDYEEDEENHDEEDDDYEDEDDDEEDEDPPTDEFFGDL